MKKHSEITEQSNIVKPVLSDIFLLTNGFIQTKGKFGKYFFHEKYQLFRCWFHNGELQVGKKDIEKDICVWIASLDDRNDFIELFRILTKDTVCNFNISKNDLQSNGYSFEVGVKNLT